MHWRAVFSHALAAPGFPPRQCWLPPGVPIFNESLLSSHPIGVGASEGVVTAEGGPGADTSSLDRWTLFPGAPLLGRGRIELLPGPFPQRSRPAIQPSFFFFGPFIGEDSAGPERAPVTRLQAWHPPPASLPSPLCPASPSLCSPFFLFCSLCLISFLFLELLTSPLCLPLDLLPPQPSPWCQAVAQGPGCSPPLFCCG